MKRVYIDGGYIRIMFPYDAKLVSTVKNIHPDREYKTKPVKHWVLPATPTHARLVVEALEDKGFEIYNDIHNLINSEGIEVSKLALEVEDARLREYQKEAVAFLHATDGRALIGDEMGLGKTVEALAWVKEKDGDLSRVAIVAPANVVYKWQREVQKWVDVPEEMVGILQGFSGEWPSTPFVISSYTVFTKRYLEFMEWNPDLIIADEAHYLKNHKAQRTRAMRHVNTTSEHFIALSGTPFLNRPMEMFNILNMLNSVEWKNAWKFGQQYAGGQSGKVDGTRVYMGTFKGKTNVDELRERLRSYMIRRLKTDVLDELPDLTRTLIPLDIPNMKEYDEARYAEYDNPLVKVTTLWRIAGQGKAREAVGWVENFFDSSEPMTKLVVYCHHIDNVLYLSERLSRYGVTTITGDVSAKERDRRIENYQTPGGPRIIIITSAGSEGIDLFGLESVDSSHILFVEREWTPAREEQIEGRLHRMGQPNPVEAHYLLARGTLDHKMAELLDVKRGMIRDVVGLNDPKTSVQEDLIKEVTSD